MTIEPQVVVVSRPTELELLLAEHGTRGQVEHFLAQRGLTLDELDRRHQQQAEALTTVAGAIPETWRRATVARSELDRWIFDPDQIVVAVGQDGLVANVAKHLDGQPVIGITPDPDGPAGILARHRPDDAADLLRIIGGAGPGRSKALEARAMVEAVVDDGRRLRALNELFVGHRSHQSARYTLTAPGAETKAEAQSSSGLIVGTGTGATGWCASIWRDRGVDWALPSPCSTGLAWFVREAWPSPATGVSLTEGLLVAGHGLRLRSQGEGLVVFGDGIEDDRLSLRWGQEVELGLASTALLLAC